MKLQMYANLHNHTTHSDGVFTPEELVKVAKEEGYFAVAAADHDTITAYPEMKAACEREGLETLLACEFYAMCDRYKHIFPDYHLVGFDFDPEHTEMKEYLRKRSADMTSKTEYLFDAAQREGLLTKEIKWQDVLDRNPGVTWFCNDHVYIAMHEMGLVSPTEWPHYFKTCFGAARQKAINADANKRVKHPIMQIEDLIDLIHDAGGIAVIAHPGEQCGQLETVPDLVRCGIDGIEVWHSDNVRAQAIQKTLEYAREYGLYISGGEDHSGLCGGQYKFFDKPEESIYYAEELSLGTRKEFFEEIKNKRMMSGREELIGKYIELYNEE